MHVLVDQIDPSTAFTESQARQELLEQTTGSLALALSITLAARMEGRLRPTDADAVVTYHAYSDPELADVLAYFREHPTFRP